MCRLSLQLGGICNHQLMVVVLTMLLTACAHDSSQKHHGVLSHKEPPQNNSSIAKSTAQQSITTDSILNQQLLEQLLLMNLAYAQKDWVMAYEQAIAAAKTSQDWRLLERAVNVSLISMRDYTAAQAVAELWLQHVPDSSTAQLSWVASQVGLGQVAAALPIAMQFLDQASAKTTASEAEAFSSLAQYLRVQSNRAAVSLMQALYARYSDSPEFLFNAALIAAWFKRESLAEQWLTQAQQLQPGYVPAALLRYEFIKANQGVSFADEFLRTTALKYDDEQQSLRNKLLISLYDRGEYQTFLSASDALVLQHSWDIPILYLRALSFLQLDNQSAAEKMLLAVLAVDASHQDTLLRLGLLAYTQQQYADAIQWFQQIRQADLMFEANMRIAQAQAALEPGDIGVRRALRQLNNVEARTQPDFVRHAVVRDQILQANQEYWRAFGYISEALVVYPNVPELLYRRGLLAAEVAEFAIAEKDLRQLLAVRSNNATALNALGYILVEGSLLAEDSGLVNAQLIEAKGLIEQALLLEPNSYHILDSMGWVLFQLGDYQPARRFLQKAYALQADPEIAAHLSEVLFAVGEQQQAKQLLKKTLLKHPEHDTVLQSMRRLGLDL